MGCSVITNIRTINQGTHDTKHINRMPKMTSHAPTNAGKYVTSNDASAHSQRYT